MSEAFEIAAEATAAEARATLIGAGWRLIGVGDWSWVFASPDGASACRVTPIDPAHRMFAEACLSRPANRWLPAIERLLPLRRAGYMVFMERLFPADPEAAAAFCAVIAGETKMGRDADMAGVRALISELGEAGARRFRLWGGADVRPGNVMADAQGWLKLVDPLYVSGREVVAAIEAGAVEALAGFAPGELEDFLTIPVFPEGEATAALRAKLVAVVRLLGR
ncbi:MAG TPA: hypothetical protein VGS12_00220 [Caulobacteraceae bacterium]|nr:hypothetical protein [Caulobacteraceae bacterium]